MAISLKLEIKSSISKKLFFITIGFIVIVLSFNYIIQNMFFQDFYLNKKTKKLTSEINTFRQMYSYQGYNKNVLQKAMLSFEYSNNSKLAILVADENILFSTEYSKFDDLNSLTAFCRQLLENQELIDKSMKSNSAQSISFFNKATHTDCIGVIIPISIYQENDSLLISVTSVQPIAEADSVINEFYKFIILGFLVVGIFLSIIYTNLVTKPLVRINRIADKMAKMDFSESCQVYSDDEIGNLGNTLNFLSTNLKNSLDDLNAKNEQLQADIDKERQLELLRQDFVAGVSHELKTPIGIIQGYAEGIKDGIVSGDEANEYLNIILAESHKMSTLVTNMLEISKLDSGIVKLNIETFNILRLIKHSLNNISIKFADKNINFSVISEFPYVYVEADIFQIEQVITNILTNAFKYTEPNNNISISIVAIDEFYEISVFNENTHIPEEELNNLFSKFYRLEKSRNRDSSSHGLGLSIVKRLLDMHGSKFSLSNVDNGVVFTFQLKKGKEPEL